ncbi:cell division protein ZipA C-terminal FtsZ-binding domain-containing protein [soil metagenome]
MSPLQLALIGVGVALLALLVIYNLWQERRAVKAARIAFGGSDADPLDAPSILRKGPPTEPQALRKTGRLEPNFGSILGADGGPDTLIPNTPDADANGDLAFDDEIELIVSLSFDHPVDGERLAPMASRLASIGTKPLQVGATEARSYKLEPAQAGSRYSGLHCAVLLANRQGPLSAIEFSSFVGAVQSLAAELDVEPDIPEMNETLERARELDQRCAAVDAQIGVNVVGNGAPWRGSEIARAAIESVVAQRIDGRFAFYRRSGAELFTLQALDPQGQPLAIGTNAGELVCTSLTLVLDVPRAPEVEKPFTTLINLARALAARLGASVVDDNRRPLTDASLAGIEVQLGPMYARLREAGFEAGTPRALRLFN